MTDYIKRDDAIFIALQQPFFQNSMATEIRQLLGINLVMCSECRHWTYEELCEVFTKPMCFDDFCSYGEREDK